MFGLTEALTRRRAVAVGRPIAVSSGSILASKSFTIVVRALNKRLRGFRRIEAAGRTVEPVAKTRPPLSNGARVSSGDGMTGLTWYRSVRYAHGTVLRLFFFQEECDAHIQN